MPDPATCGMADDTRATFSNFGAVVDVAAPGVCIASTGRAGGYVTMSGTSMASPHVAGAAATYIAQRGLAANGDRARLVREAFRGEWGAGQASPCGFSGGRSAEPVLVMGGCPSGGDTVPPAGVALTARPDSGTVQLSWSAATDASGIAAYRLYRATGTTGAFSLRATLPATATGHLDTGLVNGTVYRYSVTAVDGAGNAGGSAVVSATPRDVTAPAAPVLAAVGHDRSVTLTWPGVTDASGIRGYQLWRAVPGSAVRPAHHRGGHGADLLRHRPGERCDVRLPPAGGRRCGQRLRVVVHGGRGTRGRPRAEPGGADGRPR